MVYEPLYHDLQKYRAYAWFFITSYPTRAHGIIVIYPTHAHGIIFNFQTWGAHSYPEKRCRARGVFVNARGLLCKLWSLSRLGSLFFYVAPNIKPQQIPKLYYALKRRSKEKGSWTISCFKKTFKGKRIYLGRCSSNLSCSWNNMHEDCKSLTFQPWITTQSCRNKKVKS